MIVSLNSNTTDVTTGEGTFYLSEAPYLVHTWFLVGVV